MRPKELESYIGRDKILSLLDWRPPGEGQERGTENVPYIIGLGKACELAKRHLDEENTKVRSLRDYLEAKLLEKIPNTLVNGDRKNRLPNTTSLSFEFVEGESILLLLSDLGICASSGSACTSGPWSLRMSSGPWECLLPQRTDRSGSASPSIARKKRWITSSNISLHHSEVERHLTLLERLSESPGEGLTGCRKTPICILALVLRCL